MSARWPLACFVAMGLFWGAFAALLPELRFQVGATDGELGLALLGTGIGALPAMLVTGRLWRRRGWSLMPLTALGFGVASVTLLLPGAPLGLAIAMILVGASSGALDVAMNSAVSELEVTHSRRLMYAAHALFSLAVLIGSVGTGIARALGVGPAGVLPIVALVFVIVTVGSAMAARQASMLAPETEATAQAGPSALQAIGALALLCALGFLIEDAVQNWSALMLERELQSGPALGGAAPGIFAAAMFVGRSSGHWLGRRFGDRDLLVGGALGAAVGLVIVAAAPVPVVALAGFGMAGAGVALVAPALFARAGRMAAPGRRGAAIATLSVVGYTGFLVGPVVVGLVSQTAGLRVAIAVLAGLAIALAIGGLVVLRGPRAARFDEGDALVRTSRL